MTPDPVCRCKTPGDGRPVPDGAAAVDGWRLSEILDNGVPACDVAGWMRRGHLTFDPPVVRANARAIRALVPRKRGRARRTCLRCGKEFNSAHPGNRLCEFCGQFAREAMT